MEKRVLLAVFLCFVVLYAYQALFVKTPPPRPRPAPQAQAKGAAVPPPPAVGQAPAEQAKAPAAAAAPSAAVSPVVSEPSERTITIETKVVHVVFTNRGGTLLSWRLKHYFDDRRQPLELVPGGLPAGTPRPFTLRLEDPEATARLDQALFRVSEGASTVDGTKGRVRLVFDYQDAAGLHARKEFTFEPDSYVVLFDASAAQGNTTFNPTVVWGPALGDLAGAAESSRYLQKPEGIFFQQGSVVRMSAKQLASDPDHEGDLRFAGVDDHYFVSAVLPKGKKMRVEYQPVTVPGAGQGAPANELVSYGVKVARATPGMRVFAGPKDFDVLRSTDPEMVRVINFGFFAWLAVPLLRALKSINAYVGNYGWAIIILTILINAAMFPLRHKSMVSMRKLQQLQPEIKAIQDRYSKLKTTDPARQKMNVEMMGLYRERGVNPASGCLPMLLTMPVLFAFYAMLGQAIEVRGAPFGLWIQDLSRHDPYYVTPILMGLTMLWQQKMTPSSVDPAQQKMMMIMPIFFTAFFLWAPSGLALYFLLSNLLAIGQQYLTNNLIAPAGAGRVPRSAKGAAK